MDGFVAELAFGRVLGYTAEAITGAAARLRASETAAWKNCALSPASSSETWRRGRPLPLAAGAINPRPRRAAHAVAQHHRPARDEEKEERLCLPQGDG
jgi:hypothetical protein